MAGNGTRKWTTRNHYAWRVAKDNKRQLPCHPAVRIRVKVLEPGVQSRWCDRCQAWRYFTLEPMANLDHTLKLRWLNDTEVKTHEETVDAAPRFTLGSLPARTSPDDPAC